MDQSKRPSAKLTSDLLVEILSRVPPKSFYRFKRVGKSWFTLSSDPHYRKKLPQPPSALIYETFDIFTNTCEANYTKISQFAPHIDAPLGFLPIYDRLKILDHCNGLLMCSCSNYSPFVQCIFVCNPATKKWTTITRPESSDKTGRLFLAFDPISLNFHILNFHELENESEKIVITNLEVFSSETNIWVQSQTEWTQDIELIQAPGSIFLNGLVHTLVKSNVMAVNPTGNSMELIPFPDSADSKRDFRIGKSQGSLLYSAKFEEEIVIWALDETKEWILKYRVNIASMFAHDEFFYFTRYPQLVAFDSEQEMVFFVGMKQSKQTRFFSYELNSGEISDICNLGSKLESNTYYYIPHYIELDCLSGGGT